MLDAQQQGTDFWFQSARPRGARHGAIRGHDAPHAFQSARPRGARRSGRRPLRSHGLVSIRAPARGATRPCRSRQARCSRFNPRAREGRDVAVGALVLHMIRFQSARPRGARPDRANHGCTSACFNPRAREGRDAQLFPSHSRFAMFQSARPRGARRRSRSPPGCMRPFQSARPRGARPGGRDRAGACRHVSIRAPARGATIVGKVIDGQFVPFQSARPRGARLYFVEHQHPDRCFNPRAREGRDQGYAFGATG